MDGNVEPEGVELTTIEEYPPTRHRRFFRHGEFDICEVSLASYVSSLSEAQEYPCTAIPVFPEKKFRHSFFYKHDDADVDGPADLEGRKVGIQSWQTTANVWIRGIAQEHYGLDLEQVQWYRRKEDDVARDVPDRFDIQRIGRDAVSDPSVLRQMFFEGDLAAAMDPAGEMFNAVIESDEASLMFDNPIEEEQRYYRETGIHPPMHLVAIRDEILEDNPWVARNVFEAFCESRDQCLEWNRCPASHTSLPWSHLHRHEYREVMGENIWEFGLTEKTRREVSKFIEYAHDQGLVPRQYDVEELFVGSTLELESTPDHQSFSS